MSDTASNAIYAPPTAEVCVVDREEPLFYVVAPAKFLWLSIMTMGMYFVYWFYRNWRQVRIHNGASISPVMRGIFHVFFVHRLFGEVERRLERQGGHPGWRPEELPTRYVVMLIGSNLLGHLADHDVGMPVTLLASIVITVLMAFVLLPGQRAINLACGDPDGSANRRLTGANWLWLVLGGLFWANVLIVVVAALLMPELLAR